MGEDMSLHEDGRWCDLCWTSIATVIYFRDDGSRLDCCKDCDPLDDEPDLYRIATAYRALEPSR